MTDHPVVSRAQWLEQRKTLLAREKAFTRERDALSAARRALPWVRIDTDYVFDGADGPVSLTDLFGPHSQLVVYHFMFGRDWEDGCVSCSFWADNFNGIEPHLNARDIAFAAISRGPLDRILPFKRRMGWDFPWVSSANNTFSKDFQVSFAEDRDTSEPVTYNYRETVMPMNEMPGVSVFARGGDGTLYHTYSTYGRGLDILNGAYNYIDLTPKGRDEPTEGNPMAWVRHHDRYE
jgi:predicted dithiol-disulfide oxidoreductase (DUF899 family)